ncbi:MAG: hypothetical protein SVO01_00850 [Thermotogota bacterium]|nr:hypothetical protein [Thermotogota bacterium]
MPKSTGLSNIIDGKIQFRWISVDILDIKNNVNSDLLMLVGVRKILQSTSIKNIININCDCVYIIPYSSPVINTSLRLIFCSDVDLMNKAIINGAIA